MDIKAYVDEEEHVELKEVQLKDVGADELLIRIVEQTGSAVTDFEEGDHVVVSFNYCGKCANCLNGVSSACEDFFAANFDVSMDESDSKIADGDKKVARLFGQSPLATHCISNIRNTIKIEDKDVVLALLGPLACGIQTGAGTVLNKLKPGVGDAIAIFGCGSVGLSAVMGAKLANCKTIIAADVHENRLETAKEFGATHVINSGEEDSVESIRSITNGGAHFAIEASGVSPVVLQSIRSVRPLGIIALVGVAGNLDFHIHDEMIPTNKTMVGVVEGQAIPKLFIPELISQYKAGKFPFDKLIRRYGIDELDKAIEDMEAGETLKPFVEFS